MRIKEAAEYIGISVRSLQRNMSEKRIAYTQRRGVSGKMENIFDVAEVERFKTAREAEETKTALIPLTTETALTIRDDAMSQSVALIKEALQLQPSQASAVAVEAKLLLKLDECAAMTGLSRQMLREAIDAKKLKARIIGRAWRVKRSDLDAYIKKL